MSPDITWLVLLVLLVVLIRYLRRNLRLRRQVHRTVDLELARAKAQQDGDIGAVDQIDAELAELGKGIKRPMV